MRLRRTLFLAKVNKAYIIVRKIYNKEMSDLPRFFINPNKIFNNKFILENPGDIKKIRQVLRLTTGDHILLLDNNGSIYEASIEKPKKTGITGIVISRENLENDEMSHLILGQALTRSGKMDDIIRMNTEIGVNEFIPFESNHSVFKLKQFKPQKMDRWQKIAKEAARQSERSYIPVIRPPIKFDDVLSEEADIKLILHSREVTDSIDIRSIKSILKGGERILALIGPEGGFSETEIEGAQNKGFQTIYLNTPVLRTETVGIVLSSILLY